MDDLFHILPGLVKEFEGDENMREKVLFGAWRRLVGEELAGRTAPVSLRKKRLVLAVENETWRKNLAALAGQMIFKINSALGQPVVTFIEFVIDEMAVLRVRAKYEKEFVAPEDLREQALDEVSDDLRRAADAITDDELRYKFLLAAGISLVRKKDFKREG